MIFCDYLNHWLLRPFYDSNIRLKYQKIKQLKLTSKTPLSSKITLKIFNYIFFEKIYRFLKPVFLEINIFLKKYIDFATTLGIKNIF